jgi:cytoskeletal protein CcmA (bactofilin family)
MKKTNKDIAILGPQTVLEGNLVFEGTLFLNAHVNGSIESRTGEIVIGEDAVIHADVFVRTATIKGEIKGTVRATELIELQPPARMHGDLYAPVVQIDTGVIFAGAVNECREYSKTDEIIPQSTGVIRLHK